MRRGGYILLLLGVVLSIWAQERVSLEECRQWARMNYPLIHQYGLIDQTEQYNLSNAAKSWLPQFAVHAQATYQSEVTRLPLDTEKLSSLIPGFDLPTVSKDQYKITAELNQTIWDGGISRSVREITRAEAAANREQLEADLYALTERVDQLYFGVLLQDELLRQNELLQKELGVNIERIAAMIANGTANLSDRESLEVEVLNTKQKRIDIQASRSAYLQMLAAFVDKPLGNVLLETPVWPGFDRSMAIHRPELKALDARISLIDAQNKQIHAGLMPRLGAFVQGGYGRPGLNMLEDSFNPYYIAGLRFSWNLGNLYTMKDDRRKIETNMRGLALQRETFLFNTRLQLIGQDAEVQKIQKQIETDEEILRLRSSIKRAAEVKLENGVISVTDLIREINAEDLARQAAATRQVQYLMAAYKYGVMQGRE
ncbi:TolC family protein [Parabacteroides sp. PF5-6]|uniref:TolC family protein n=1 Tax=Parabacteroides sp. PF5-6 TaxID=1742403 RepID=UPI002407306C|nr:TolC family protein [Parabacteroides sp. PF5-6]MDF9828824.1 outer membrane protein TolC [Parabacteroides sp. PF5-6]